MIRLKSSSGLDLLYRWCKDLVGCREEGEEGGKKRTALEPLGARRRGAHSMPGH